MRLFPGSMAVRMTLGQGFIALLVFATAGVLLQRALASELQQADQQELHGKVGVVRHFIDEFARGRDLQVLHHHFDDMLIGHKRLAIRIVASDGAEIYRGSGLPVNGNADANGFGLALALDGTPFETIRSELGVESPWPGGQIVLGLDTRPREALLERHRNVLLGICALGVALTVALGALAARRGLVPVKRLSQQAGRITAHSLDMRLVDHHNAKEMEGLVAAFNAVLNRLQAAYKQMEAFSANVAHELRTPLATLISGSQLMLSAPRTTSELKEAIGSNLEELQQMSQLINDMLFLARADQGDRAIGLKRTDLAADVDRTLKYCQPLLDEAGLTGARVGAACAQCSATLIQRALVNLLVNAIRHTERGGCIVVKIEAQGDRVSLAVENPGLPIPDHIRARMFDRFFRADDARARAGASHGLGLTIVAAIAQMHGGTVFSGYADRANRVGLVIPLPAQAEAATVRVPSN